jgi:hypothetical protein
MNTTDEQGTAPVKPGEQDSQVEKSAKMIWSVSCVAHKYDVIFQMIDDSLIYSAAQLMTLRGPEVCTREDNGMIGTILETLENQDAAAQEKASCPQECLLAEIAGPGKGAAQSVASDDCPAHESSDGIEYDAFGLSLGDYAGVLGIEDSVQETAKESESQGVKGDTQPRVQKVRCYRYIRPVPAEILQSSKLWNYSAALTKKHISVDSLLTTAGASQVLPILIDITARQNSQGNYHSAVNKAGYSSFVSRADLLATCVESAHALDRAPTFLKH